MGVERWCIPLYDSPWVEVPQAKGRFLRLYSEKCQDFLEMTGKAGDVILLHPLMVHSQSFNSLRIPRIITNPPVSLNEPFNFDRKDPSQYSVVERKTLQDLGKDRLRGWKIKGSRESVVPERLDEQEKMKNQDLGRLNG
ncbi:hypothetical protein N7494_004146 [Penicillium frequentans]|uniref:Uncharacterized protein n=1 Tax=Penicillium frequentans TaxID=3151616 RepID=A0AAD6D026_9EURO|nr:hypothetical protein N7494_004146 [Penicillium glabrum]